MPRRRLPEPDAKGSAEPEPQTRKARLDDVARLAGVGIATVDRVMNERGGVMPETARKVIEAAQRLQIGRKLPSPYRQGLRIAVVFPGLQTQFFRRFNEAVIQTASTLDREVTVLRLFVDADEPSAVATLLRQTHANAFILYATDSPPVIEAVNELDDAGIPVVTFFTDIPGSRRAQYVGIDHRQAGRTAGFFAARMMRAPGPVVVFCRGLEYNAHLERLGGFNQAIVQHAPGVSVGPIISGAIERPETVLQLQATLSIAKELAAIYSTGGATEEIGEALAKTGWAGRTIFIGHELTSASRDLLGKGTMTLAIDQNPELQIRRAIDTILERFGILGARAATGPVPFTIYGAENIG